MWGLKRRVFSNEAGIGSVPNIASSAEVSHHVKQGFIQSMGVIFDTMVICTSSAFIVLTYVDPLSLGEMDGGVALVAAALSGGPLGSAAPAVISVFLVFFAFTSIIRYYSVCELNLKFVSEESIYSGSQNHGNLRRSAFLSCAGPAHLGPLRVFMAVMGISNMIAVLLLSGYVVAALKDYKRQKAAGLDPMFDRKSIDLDASGIFQWDGTG